MVLKGFTLFRGEDSAAAIKRTGLVMSLVRESSKANDSVFCQELYTLLSALDAFPPSRFATPRAVTYNSGHGKPIEVYALARRKPLGTLYVGSDGRLYWHVAGMCGIFAYREVNYVKLTLADLTDYARLVRELSV